jgi:hypothetical protein
MPNPTKLPTNVASGTAGHVAHTNSVHAAVNNLTVMRQSTRTGAYGLALVDSGEVIEFSTADRVAVTVPLNSEVPFPVGTVILVCQYGSGQVTVKPAPGVTIRTASSLTTRAQFSELSLRKRAANEWVASGDLT